MTPNPLGNRPRRSPSQPGGTPVMSLPDHRLDGVSRGVWVFDVPARPESVRLARRTVAEIAGVDGSATNLADIELITSELVTNAVQHGSAPIQVRAEVVDGVLRVDVHDASPWLPIEPSAPSPDAERRRGLAIVHALADHYGYDRDPDGGKTVWFDRLIG